MNRTLARPGLSYYDANRHRLVTEFPDVTALKRRIRETWPELEVLFDVEAETFLIIEHCRDHTDRLVCELQPKDFNDKLFDRLAKADQASRDNDYERDVDKFNQALTNQMDHELHESLGDFVDRFRHALKKDGFYDHMDVFGANVGRKVAPRQVIRDHLTPT